MSVTLLESAAPSMEDARRAAAALLAEGAEEVYLYGSLAHGEATAHSDIDLVALFADIDYNERYELTRRLEKAASEAIAQRWPVQIFTTDRPEWKARTERVPSSFESHISTRGLVPVGQSATRGKVQWGKAMVCPMSDPEEALRKFGDEVLSELEDLQTSTVANKRESDPDYILQEDTRLNRMVRVCTKAAMAVEKLSRFWPCCIVTLSPTKQHAVSQATTYPRAFACCHQVYAWRSQTA